MFAHLCLLLLLPFRAFHYLPGTTFPAYYQHKSPKSHASEYLGSPATESRLAFAVLTLKMSSVAT